MRGTWRHCCFSSPTRLTFGIRADWCDDFGHKCDFHLVALWAFKISGNQCPHNVSLSQWVSLLLAIGSVNNLTQSCSCWCSMHTTMWVYTSFYTLWEGIESFNYNYLIFYWMLLILLVVVNNNALMVLLNTINGKNRWSPYTVTLLSCSWQSTMGPHGLLLWPGMVDMILRHGSLVTHVEVKILDGIVTLLASSSLACSRADTK